MTATSAHSAFHANPFPDLPAIRGSDVGLQPARPVRRFPSPRFGDYSRTRFESRVAFGGPDEGEDAEDFPSIATPTRQFSLLEITSGLPDDSREDDERAEGGRLRDLRARVKAARAVVSRTPGLSEILARDWQRAALFYARFQITEAQFRLGVRETPGDEPDMPERPSRVCHNPTDRPDEGE
jgi:hypothetical protein